MKNMLRTLSGVLKDKAFQSFFNTVRKYKWLYVLTIVSQIGLTGIALSFAEISRKIFDMAPNIPHETLGVIIGAIIGVTVLQIGLSFINSWIRSLLNESVVYSMRRDVLNQLQHLPLSFHENNHSSNSFNIMYSELEIVKNFLVFDLQRLITLPLSFIFIGIYLVTVHPLLAAIAIVIGPMQLVSNFVLKKKFQRAVDLQNNVTRDVFRTISETLHGIREIKANQLEHNIDRRMEDIQKKGVDYNVLLTQISMVRNIVKDAPGQLGYVLGIGVGAVIMASGHIGPGGLVAFITLLGKVSEPFTALVEIITSIQRSVSGARRLYDVMSMPIEEKHKGASLQMPIKSIRFNKVSFHYIPDIETIVDVNFEVMGGSTIALVGPSGAGKSTLIKLLYRFYDPQKGTIEINGMPICMYSLESLRNAMGLVSQDIFIFDGTVFENIAAGRPDIPIEDVKRAAVLAQAHEFIEKLPMGYDTEVGENGVKLSQGQKQRLSIARAVLRNAPILIMDEPTSALDVETEAMFQKNLGEWADNCTKIIIAHRLSTIRQADYVIFLDSGNVVEHGTPAKLLKINGRFRAYWEKQGLLEDVS